MNNFKIINWGWCHTHPEELGFESDGDKLSRFHAPKDSVLSKLDLWEVVKLIYDSGLNVMIKHEEDEDSIAVDTKRFQQR